MPAPEHARDDPAAAPPDADVAVRLLSADASRLPTELPSELPAGTPADRAAIEVPPPRVPIPRWVARLAALCAVGLVPWIVYLAFALPQHERAAHYDVAWVGFDVGVAVVLASLAVCAARRKPATGPLAAVAATLLVVDSWFDVVTSSGRMQFMFALGSALVLELPLAALCTWVSFNAERLRARAYRRLYLRAEHATWLALRLAEAQQRWEQRRRSVPGEHL
jgi:hypothetical protein